MSNVGPGGTLDTDRVARALLQHRNCPDPTTELSPAQIVFGRTLKDHLPIQPGALHVRQEWRLDAERREQALAHRHLLKHEQLLHGTKPLPPLNIGDHVMVQDQAAVKQPGKWTKTGKVVEDQGFDSYLIKMDGSNRVTKRNRRFLRKVVPFIHATDNAPELRTRVPLTTPQQTLSSKVLPQIPVTPPPLSTQKAKTQRKELWIVADKFKPKHSTSNNPSPVHKPETDVNDDQKQVDLIDDNEDHTSDVNEDHVNDVGQYLDVETSDAPTVTEIEPSSSTNPNQLSSPPILLPNMMPPAPGSSHNYEAMARESQRLREQVSASRL